MRNECPETSTRRRSPYAMSQVIIVVHLVIKEKAFWGDNKENRQREEKALVLLTETGTSSQPISKQNFQDGLWVFRYVSEAQRALSRSHAVIVHARRSQRRRK